MIVWTQHKPTAPGVYVFWRDTGTGLTGQGALIRLCGGEDGRLYREAALFHSVEKHYRDQWPSGWWFGPLPELPKTATGPSSDT